MSGIPERFESWLAAFAQLDVLVVGDVMLDEYLHGDVERVSPEAPVPIVAVAREVRALGGAGNVVRNLAALGARPRLCTVVGDDEDGRRVIDALKELGVDTSGVVVDDARCTTRKTRVLARGQQMIRADRESTHALDADLRGELERRVVASLRGVDGVALVDYAKGVLAPDAAARIVAVLRQAGVPIAVDPKGFLDAYAGVDLLKPNLSEALELVASAKPKGASLGTDGADVNADPDGLALATALGERLPGADIAITLGERGMAICPGERDVSSTLVPTSPLGVYDVQGAGDTSLAALWLARLAGAGLEDAACLANAASGVAVSKVGTATASVAEVRAQLPAVLAVCERAGRNDVNDTDGGDR